MDEVPPSFVTIPNCGTVGTEVCNILGVGREGPEFLNG